MDVIDNTVDNDMKHQADGDPTTRDSASKVMMKRLAGGYVNHLRQNAQRLLSQVTMSKDIRVECVDLGTFVAHMRAKPSKKQEEYEIYSREFSSRLVSQLGKLAIALSAVLNKKEVDREVMDRVRRIALDTSRGNTLRLCKQLHKLGRKGMSLDALAISSGKTSEKQRKLLTFLNHEHLEVVEYYTEKAGQHVRTKWRLTPRLHELYGEVMKHA
jgi:hypothetical protein